ncbi:MAG: sulfatase [Lentisphaerales bacterium]|nr:sulfatase [Lentisphaerales bacterium]
MRIKETICRVSLLMLFALVGASCTSTDVNERPNVVLIIADDMNWNDCGAYGHPTIRTAHLDKLAATGMRFDHAYLTASSCSPSRSSIITGRYPHNTGAEQLHWALPKSSLTFVEQLKDSGYYTAAAGKWHLGNNLKDRFDLVVEANVAGFQLPTGDGKTPPKMVADKKPSGCEDWVPVLKQRPKDKPFFMWFAALDPHRAYEQGALNPPHKTSDIIVPPHMPDHPDVREDLRLYYDEIGRLDLYVGRVKAELEKQGVADNTVIIFMSDNGRPFPRDKTSLYDGGIKTPFIVNWPAGIKPDQVSKSLVSSIDIGPTILELAGLKAGSTFEGKSFAGILQDPTEEIHEYVFGEDHWHDYEDHARSIGNQNFKLIRNSFNDLPTTPSADAGRSLTWQAMLKLNKAGKLNKIQQACFTAPRPKYELYDLKKDPHEIKNLANDPAYQGVFNKLKVELAKWSERTGDYVPSKRTPDEFDRVTGEPDHSVRKRPRPSKMDMYGTNGKY